MHAWTDAIGYFAAFLLVLTFFMRKHDPIARHCNLFITRVVGLRVR